MPTSCGGTPRSTPTSPAQGSRQRWCVPRPLPTPCSKSPPISCVWVRGVALVVPGRVALIDTRDVAQVFAVILTDDPHRHAGKTYDISGPAALTMDEVAGHLSAAVGTHVEYHARTEAQQRTVLESTGLSALMVDVLIGVDDITRDNVYAVPSPTVYDLTGHAPRSVKDWVNEHVSLFGAPAA